MERVPLACQRTTRRVLNDDWRIILLPELTRTAAGWESQLAVNHLGHFALAVGLHDVLAAAVVPWASSKTKR